MIHEITDEMRAMVAARVGEGRGGARRFAEACGLDANVVYQVVSGRRPRVLDPIWARLCMGAPELCAGGAVPEPPAPRLSPVDEYRLRVSDMVMADTTGGAPSSSVSCRRYSAPCLRKIPHFCGKTRHI